MARLRSIYEDLGCRDVTTYLQSGNVVFRHDDDPAGVAAGVEASIKRELGLEIHVLGRTQAQLKRVVATDPFPNADPSRRFVMFLSAAPSAEVAREHARVTSGADEALLVGREVYLHCPDGVGNSKLPGLVSERRLGVTATNRNWRTVTQLLELSSSA